MENKTDTKEKSFDFSMIKSSLNSSMEQDDISVSEDLVKKTMNLIKPQADSNPSITSNNHKWKSKLNFTNVAAAVLLVFLIGTVVGKNLLDNNMNMAKKDDRIAPELGESLASYDVAQEDNGDYQVVDDMASTDGNSPLVTDATGGGGLDGKLPMDSTTSSEGATMEEAMEESGLTFSYLTNLEYSDVESLEVYYYMDNSVINKDLSLKKEEVFDLLNLYLLDEVNVSPEEEWVYKLSIVPSGLSIYTIYIGNDINISIESKTSSSTNVDESKNQFRRTFKVSDVEGLKIQLDQLINAK